MQTGVATKAATCRYGGNPAADCAHCQTRHLAFCSALEKDELQDMERIVGQLELAPGGQIFMESDPAKHVFNVTGGTVRLYKLLGDGRRQVVGFLAPGDFLGLSVRQNYAYGAEAVDQVTLCRFRTDELRALFRKYPKLEHRLLEMTGDELAAAQEQMMLLGRKTPQERLATFLLDLQRRWSRWGDAEAPIRLAMTRSDIADYLGLTIETVSRTFTKLRKDGVIALPDPATVQVLDRNRLEDLASGLGD